MIVSGGHDYREDTSLLGMGHIPLGLSRLGTFDVSSESRRACRAVLFQHGGRRTGYSARLYKFRRTLTYYTHVK